MAIYGSTHWLEVWGDLAGFFPPDAKVEAYSYPIITPSAARNIFRAIYMNPYQFEWVVRYIATLEEPRYINVKSNELKITELIPGNKLIPFLQGKCKLEEVALPVDSASKPEVRTQRNRYLLHRPRFWIAAEMRFWDEDADILKHEEMFLRRARNGQYARRPYLGLRELTANFKYLDRRDIDSSRIYPLNRDLGYMVYDPWDITVRPVLRLDGRIDREATAKLAKPNRFKKFHAVVHNGWLTPQQIAKSFDPPMLPRPEVIYDGVD